MNDAPPITYSADADGVGWIVFDDPASRANVVTPAAQAALGDAITRAERDDVRAVIITSGKANIFIAGADLRQLAAFPDTSAAWEFSRTGQRLYERIATLRFPVVCAIHGACAGGGFELALACAWRIATDATVTRIGLPETSIGTIPGWGGSVRLPRLVGVRPALEHILRAQLVTAEEARHAGMIHDVVPVLELRTRAKATALRLAREGRPGAPSPASASPEIFHELRAAVRAKTREWQPAPLAAIDVVEQTSQRPIGEALEIEARVFGEVTAGEVCKNLVHVFFLREAAKKRTLEGWFERRSDSPHPESDVAKRSSDRAGEKSAPKTVLPRRVGVVGAGVMGSGIAHWLATHGFDVVLRDVQPDLIDRGLKTVRGLLDEGVRRNKLSAGAANAALHRISTTIEWEGFEDCDVVIEAIVEDVKAKRALFDELKAVVRADVVLASNTSALPMEDIARESSDPSRVVGIHFFNPVSRMPLVELIIGDRTSHRTAERALELVKALGKSPIICRSSPGFLVTRVLFFYLNDAVRQWEEGVTTERLDHAMREFGWPMGPLRLIDEVGVDVTDFIFREMEHYFPKRFRCTTACGRLVAAGLKGRKDGTGRGFYRHDARNEVPNEDETRAIAEAGGETRTQVAAGSQSTESSHLSERLMHAMTEEARRCLAEGVVKSAEDVDFALLSGAGFPAFRGGLLRWAGAY